MIDRDWDGPPYDINEPPPGSNLTRRDMKIANFTRNYGASPEKVREIVNRHYDRRPPFWHTLALTAFYFILWVLLFGLLKWAFR